MPPRQNTNMRVPYEKPIDRDSAQVYLCWKRLQHIPCPVYLSVILDRTHNNSSQVVKVKEKTETRVNILMKLSNLKWCDNPVTIKTTAQTFCHSSVEYACPVWGRLLHIYKVDTVWATYVDLSQGVWNVHMYW